MLRKLLLATAAIVVLSSPAWAGGCLAGAAAGAVAGHYSHHTLSGILGGCLTGRVLAADYRKWKQEHPDSHLSFSQFVKQQKDKASDIMNGGSNQ